MTEELLNKLTEFVLKYSNYFDGEKVKEVLKKHIEYNTILYPLDKDGDIIAIALWNVIGVTAFISEVAINPKYRGKKILKYLIAQGWSKYPWVKYISFKRERKYGSRERIYAMKRFFNKETV